jgi:hypothetical protein
MGQICRLHLFGACRYMFRLRCSRTERLQAPELNMSLKGLEIGLQDCPSHEREGAASGAATAVEQQQSASATLALPLRPLVTVRGYGYLQQRR